MLPFVTITIALAIVEPKSTETVPSPSTFKATALNVTAPPFLMSTTVASGLVFDAGPVTETFSLAVFFTPDPRFSET